MSFLDGKAVLVTGATGSFGKRFVRTVLEQHQPSRLIVFSRDELKQYEMQQSLRAPNLRYFLGDDALHTVEFDDHYVIQPNDVWWDRDEYMRTSGGRPVPDGFEYTSDKNPVWMQPGALTALLKKESIEL